MEINYKKNERRRPALDLGSMMFSKVPPQANELEVAVLGAIMLEKSAFDLISGILKPESFYTDQHQRIFKAMVELVAARMPIDELTVFQQLLKNEDLEHIGGGPAISKLTRSVVSAANIEAHARVVAQKFILREIIRIGGEAVQGAYEDSTDVFDLLDEVDKNLSKLISGNNQKIVSPINSALVKSIQRIEDLRVLDSHLTGVPSNFDSIDKITHGWQNTDLIVLAARPSVGKTAFAGNLTVNAAKYFHQQFLVQKKIDPTVRQQSAVFFSLEMSTGQLINRMLSCESEIFLDSISNGKLSEAQMKSLYKNAVGVLSELPIFIDDTGALTIFELRAKCRQLKNKHNLGLIVIDYLQLMGGANDTRNGNREQEISKISRDLKALAKELQVPIIALSQLSREPEKRSGDNKMPQLSDLRESGAIEQDADMVMFLYRPEYHNIASNEFGESNHGETHVKIAKHRNGSLDVIKLKALLHIQKFVEMDSLEEVKEKIGTGTWKPIKDHFSDKADDDAPF